MRVEVYKGVQGEFRFRIMTPEGEVAVSSPACNTREEALGLIERLQQELPHAAVFDVSPERWKEEALRKVKGVATGRLL